MPVITPPNNTDPYCGQCGYNLAGATDTSKCPECGRPLVEILRWPQGSGPNPAQRKRSNIAILGLPLYDIAFGPGPDTKIGKARGFIAMGDDAMGVIAIGGIARGGIACGGLSLGFFSLGGCAIGAIFANGGLAIAGIFAAGGAALAAGGALGGAAWGYLGTSGAIYRGSPAGVTNFDPIPTTALTALALFIITAIVLAATILTALAKARLKDNKQQDPWQRPEDLEQTNPNE